MKPVTVKLTNRFANFICEPEVQVELREHFSYLDPNRHFIKSYADYQMGLPGAWNGRRYLLQRGRVGTGLFLNLRHTLEEAGYRFRIDDVRTAPVFRVNGDGTPNPRLRPEQARAVEAMMNHSNFGGVILSATGTGKTFIAGEYMRRLDGSACFVVDELSALDQARAELSSVAGEQVGIVGRGAVCPARLTVATIQTLHKHRNKSSFGRWFSDLDVLIIDEIHVQINRSNIDIVRKIRPLAVFGLTATLELDKPHVGMRVMEMTGPVIHEYSITQGIADGNLSQGILCCVVVKQPDIAVAGLGDHRKVRYRALITHSIARNKCIAALVREGVRRGRRIIVVVERLSHLRILHKRLADVPHQVLSGAYSAEQRNHAKAAMDDGTLPVILASRIFSKSVNIKSCDTIIDATGIPNRNAAIQRYGRGVRKAEGKGGLIHIDISDKNNYFHRAAEARRVSLEAIGIPSMAVEWKDDASAVYERAIAILQQPARDEDGPYCSAETKIDGRRVKCAELRRHAGDHDFQRAV